MKRGEVEIRDAGQTVETIAVGEIFGEMALIDGDTHGASAVAVGDVELLAIDRDLFDALIRDDQDFALAIMCLLARRLRATFAMLKRLDEAGDRAAETGPGRAPCRTPAAERQVKKEGPRKRPFDLVRGGCRTLEVHAAHAAAATGHRHRAVLLRMLGDHRLGGDEEAGDRSRVLEGRAHDLGRVDDAGRDQVLVLFGLRVEAVRVRTSIRAPC